MKKNKETFQSIAFMFGFAMLSVTASCQYAGASDAGIPNLNRSSVTPIAEVIPLKFQVRKWLVRNQFSPRNLFDSWSWPGMRSSFDETSLKFKKPDQ